MFRKKPEGNPEHERLLQGATKQSLKELAICEESINTVVGDEKPLVLFPGSDGLGIAVITDAAVSVVDKTSVIQRLTYEEISETSILDTPQQGLLVMIESGRATETISIPIATIDTGRRLCSTIDPRIVKGAVPKKRKSS